MKFELAAFSNPDITIDAIRMWRDLIPDVDAGISRARGVITRAAQKEVEQG